MDLDEKIKFAEALEKTNDWEKALIKYEEILEFKQGLEVYSKIGWCLSRLGKYTDAIEKFKKCEILDSTSAKWPYMVGYQYYSLKQWKEAIIWFEKSLEKYPNYFVVKYRLAYAYLQESGGFKQLCKVEFWKALGHFDECHEIWGKSNDSFKQANKSIYFDVNFQHGKALLNLDNYLDRSIDLLVFALSLKEDDDCNYELSKAYYIKKDYKSAKNNLPKNKKYYVLELEINIDIEEGYYDKALEKVRKLLKWRKKDYLYVKLASIQYKMKEYKEAYKNAKMAIQLNPNNHKNHYALSVISYQLKLYNLSLYELENANKLKIQKYGSVYNECIKLKEEIMSNNFTNIEDDESLLDELNNIKILNSGKIISYNKDRGFGFILCDDGKKVFFHISSCDDINSIILNAKVTFDIVETDKGISATNVR